ncbi:protein C-terminal leucine carboxyl O-methyltransferase ppm1 [Aspergillus homomorphus CBS 101889]|uniref:Leucine carboxyl methyltransferase 1 n=1 Tax=Aspergillus homomorphus (strain CBS 101889) TaxID=1450537 RepID=A0A395IAT1_ASPHC|nr:S-adenosyl-L-methionine-dependent methyltransferase [Aspergillus homomorphus CBS 101889]RAL17075.1 S-adenosyl-L-methionine-dependent methyltransferase [Aspergillus homomorphus CBS 101889]
MSASQIPNLNTLRRGGGRGRLRGRGGGHTGENDQDAQFRRGGSNPKDRVVQGTDNDASVSRLSAVNLGYLEDPFASALTPPGQETRRLPIINRGTYVRTTTIDHLLTHFFLPGAQTDTQTSATPSRKKQIISLGAGSDTRIFRLLTSHPSLHHHHHHHNNNLIYHELDFPTNTAAKVRAIRGSPLLQRALGITAADPKSVTISPAADALHTPHYHLHPIDLRRLAALATSASEVDLETILPGLDRSLPTVLVSECCLMYLESEEARRVVDFFTGVFSPKSSTVLQSQAQDGDTGLGGITEGAGNAEERGSSAPAPLGLILYEPIRPDDAFGRTMVANLATRGIQLQTLHRYASLAAQRERLREHGFATGQEAADVDFLWERWVPEAEKERVAGLEMLDEMEEWRLLARHYCVAWGWREGEDTRGKVFEGWRGLEGQRE